MDQEVLSRLIAQMDQLRISSDEIASRIRSLGDVELVLDDEQLAALEHEIVTERDMFCRWMTRL